MRTKDGEFQTYHIVYREPGSRPNMGHLIERDVRTGRPFDDEATARSFAKYIEEQWQVSVEVYHVTYVRLP